MDLKKKNFEYFDEKSGTWKPAKFRKIIVIGQSNLLIFLFVLAVLIVLGHFAMLDNAAYHIGG